MLEVVAGVDDDAEPLAQELRQTQRQLGAADAAGERNISGASAAHRNRSCALGRTRSAAGRAGALQVRPRTSAAGLALRRLAHQRTAAAATASAKPTSVTSRGRPLISLSPRRSSSEGTPAAPMASPTVPSRQARPALSEITTPMSEPKCASIRALSLQRAAVGMLGQQQHAPAVVAGLQVRLVDAGVGEHQAVRRGDDQHVGRRAQHLHRLAQDRRHQINVLAGDGRKLARPGIGLHPREIEVAALGLGDDLLRHHQDVLRARAPSRPAPARRSAARARSSPGRTRGMPSSAVIVSCCWRNGRWS